MDYKYIEQLVERYFNCETSLQEEQILRTFFNQENVPENLSQYAPLFCYQASEREEGLSDEFDARILELIGEDCMSGRRIAPRRFAILAPFLRAAAVVACVLTIGGAAEKAMQTEPDVTGEPAMQVNPYIRQADINQTIRVRDVNQAEVQTPVDTIGIN